MATNWTILSSARGVRVVSPTFVEDVMELLVQTIPTGVIFQYELPLSEFNTAFQGAALNPLANEVESYMAHTAGIDGAQVLDAVWRQDVDASGLLAAFMDFTISIPGPAGRPGPFTAVVTIPWRLFGSGGFLSGAASPSGMLDAGFEALEAVANA